jgi:DNA-binding Lrp family transcriptional regulator
VKELKAKHNITGIFEVSGPYNLFLIAKFSSTIELKKLIEELAALKEVHEIETAVSYNSFKEETIPFPLKKLEEK